MLLHRAAAHTERGDFAFKWNAPHVSGAVKIMTENNFVILCIIKIDCVVTITMAFYG